jgi:hypothetical protein
MKIRREVFSCLDLHAERSDRERETRREDDTRDFASFRYKGIRKIELTRKPKRTANKISTLDAKVLIYLLKRVSLSEKKE